MVSSKLDLTPGRVGRIEATIQKINGLIPGLAAAVGVALVAFGFQSQTHWAELSGSIVGLAGALSSALLVILTSATTTPNSAVVASVSGGQWVAGAAHPAGTGTVLDPASACRRCRRPPRPA